MLMKIDQLQLGESIIQLRQTMTLDQAAQVLSNSGKGKINAMDIHRWEKKNSISYADKSNIIAIGVPLDTYREVCNTNNQMTAHVQRIEGEIAKYKALFSSPEFVNKPENQNRVLAVPVDLLNAYSTAVEKKHKAALDMVKLEKELLNPANTKKHLTAIVQALKLTNREFKAHMDELSKKYKVTFPAFDIEQQYQANLQKQQADWEEMKQR